MILTYVKRNVWSLTVCKDWCSQLIAHRVRHLNLSARMLLGLSRLSLDYLTAMRRHTKSLNLTLKWPGTPNAWHTAVSNLSLAQDELNGAVRWIGSNIS